MISDYVKPSLVKKKKKVYIVFRLQANKIPLSSARPAPCGKGVSHLPFQHPMRV